MSSILSRYANNPGVGDTKMSNRDVDHDGWLVCDGRLMDKTIYTRLFRILGYTYGGNDAIGFKLPDMRGRVIGAAGAGQVTDQAGRTLTDRPQGHLYRRRGPFVDHGRNAQPQPRRHRSWTHPFIRQKYERSKRYFHSCERKRRGRRRPCGNNRNFHNWNYHKQHRRRIGAQRHATNLVCRKHVCVFGNLQIIPHELNILHFKHILHQCV